MKRALFIANNDFRDARLNGLTASKNDVIALNEVLSIDYGIGEYDISNMVTENDIGDIQVSIKKFIDTSTKEEDTILIYYTGHGLFDEDTGKLYLAMKGSDPEDPMVGSLDCEYLISFMNRCRALTQILILDCCHSGAAVKGALKVKSIPNALKKKNFSSNKKNRILLASSSQQEFSVEENERSVFTRVLADGLKSGAISPEKADILAEDVGVYIKNWFVGNKSKYKMTPVFWPANPNCNKIIFCRNPKYMPEISDSDIVDLADSNANTRRGAVGAIAEHVKKYPLRKNVSVALNQLKNRIEGEEQESKKVIRDDISKVICEIEIQEKFREDTRAATESVASLPEGTGKSGHLVILIHGIRDPGFWQDALKAHFERHASTTVVTAKPDVGDLFRFMSPLVSMRMRPVERIKSLIQNAIAANENAEVTIIAHSFGAWAVANILHENTNILVDRLILCSSVVPNDFRWDRVLKINFGGRKNVVINDYSPFDIWPLIAKVLSFGYGDTGSLGIGDLGVTNRRYSIPHKGYRNTEFARKFWDPFIFGGKIVGGDTRPVKAPWYFVLRRVPVNYITLLTYSLFFIALSIYLFAYTGNLEITRLTYKGAETRGADGATEMRIPTFSISNDEYVQMSLYNDLWGGRFLKGQSSGRIDSFNIEVSNRPPIACGDEIDSPWLIYRTIYKISYLQEKSWWRNILAWNWRGVVKMEIDYDPGKGGPGNTDRLSIISAQGVAPGSSIVVVPSHNPDNCLDAELKDRMFAVPREFALDRFD